MTAAGTAKARPLRVLLVDDDELDRRVIRRSLRGSGLPVELRETGNPDEVIDAGLAGDWDCMLLDYRFPTGNAFDLFGPLLTQSCATRPGIVLLTGSGDERIAAESIQRGVQEYLSKSDLGPATLRRAVESAYEKVLLQREIERRDEELMRMSFYDALTELPNRQLFFDRLGQQLRDAVRAKSSFAVLMMDLNRFKAVNDTYGHEAGDVLLRQVAERMRGVIRDADTLARLGGDEFAAVLSTAQTAEGALVVAAKLREVLDAPFVLGGRRAEIGVSIGIAMYGEHGTSAEELMRHADAAMYGGKRSGRGIIVHDAAAVAADVPDATSAATLIAQGLRTRIDGAELFTVFQPQVHLRERTLVGAEALVRWCHPQLGMLPAARFVPMAENVDTIEALTLDVLDAALKQAAGWQRDRVDVPVSVNLSARLLGRDTLVPQIEARLREHDVAPGRLRLEVTEPDIVFAAERGASVLHALGALGVGLSIDDFGTGYSSLRSLRDLPVDEIKIDREFVADLSRNPDDNVIVSSIIALGRSFGIRVMAEGIEDEATLNRLLELGCELGQGFALGAPMDGLSLSRWRAPRLLPPGAAVRVRA